MRSFGGEGGRSSKDHIGSQGGGGGQDGLNKDFIIFERSLIYILCFKEIRCSMYTIWLEGIIERIFESKSVIKWIIAKK